MHGGQHDKTQSFLPPAWSWLSNIHKPESEHTAGELVTDSVIINQRLHSPLQRRHQTFRVQGSRKLFHLTRHCCCSEPAISICYLQSPTVKPSLMEAC